MYVIKRDGRKEQIMFDKITARVRKLCYGLNELVDPLKVAMRVIEGLYDGVTTSELDNLAAEIAATITPTHRHCETEFAQSSAPLYRSGHFQNARYHQESEDRSAAPRETGANLRKRFHEYAGQSGFSTGGV